MQMFPVQSCLVMYGLVWPYAAMHNFCACLDKFSIYLGKCYVNGHISTVIYCLFSQSIVFYTIFSILFRYFLEIILINFINL